MTYSHSKDKGIALVQVLLLSLVIFSVILSMKYQSDQHLRLAERIKLRSTQLLALYTAQSQVAFTLLSESWQGNVNAESDIAKNWNFYGSPFQVQGVTVEIQDVAGLMYLNSLISSQLQAFMDGGISQQQRATALAAAIKDWIDEDNIQSSFGAEQLNYVDNTRVRNAPMQFEQELLSVRGVDKALYKELEDYITLYPIGEVSVLNMPDKLYTSLFSPQIAEQLILLRQNNQLNSSNFLALTQLQESDFYTYMTQQTFRLRFTVTKDDVNLGEQMTITIQPYDREPLVYWDFRRLAF